MKIAVTAANGKLGASVIKQLKKDIGAENVIGIVRTPEKAAFLEVELRKGDYNNKADFVKALKGVDAVLLVSGMDHPEKRIQQHQNVIEAAKENGVKKIVYTSIFGGEEGNAFSPVVASNRQTEEDIRNSGMNWSIGRNGIYIEPDLEYIESYKKEGGIVNCAGNGKCNYTSRAELAFAYSRLLLDDELNEKTYNLLGEAITQQQLAEEMNKAYKLDLKYKSVSVEAYVKDRQAELGEFMGTVIGGIYEGIKEGKFEGASHFEEITNRKHKSVRKMIEEYQK